MDENNHASLFYNYLKYDDSKAMLSATKKDNFVALTYCDHQVAIYVHPTRPSVVVVIKVLGVLKTIPHEYRTTLPILSEN